MSASSNPDPQPVIDIHIHIGGKGNSTSCTMSPQFLRSAAYMYMVARSGIPLIDLMRDHDKALRERILTHLNASEHTDFGVLLALDAVFHPDGSYADEATHMVTPNEYVSGLAALEEKVLFGASVHPHRGRDAGLQLIDECLVGGAALMKWIPSSQLIDPASPKHDWFYEKLVDAGLPLLCHVGPEHAVPVNDADDQLLSDPRRLERALDIGVTVIAAHCGTAFFPGERDCMPELSGMLEEAEGRNWKLYADISALCSFFRMGMIDDVLEKIPADRMVYGSDYPVPVDTMPPGIVETLDWSEVVAISRIDNPFDKNYVQLLAMDFPQEAMTRAAGLLRLEGTV